MEMATKDTLKKVLKYIGLSFIVPLYRPTKLPEVDRKLITDMVWAGVFIACAGGIIVCFGQILFDQGLIDLITIIGIVTFCLGSVLILSGSWIIYWSIRFEF